MDSIYPYMYSVQYILKGTSSYYNTSSRILRKNTSSRIFSAASSSTCSLYDSFCAYEQCKFYECMLKIAIKHINKTGLLEYVMYEFHCPRVVKADQSKIKIDFHYNSYINFSLALVSEGLSRTQVLQKQHSNVLL